MITLICNHSLALFSVVLLIIHSRSSDSFFPNEKVQNLNIIWYYVMEKILLILVPGYTYLYIILFENTFIFIICHKKMDLKFVKKNSFFGTFW